ncbi:MAG: DUF389 domain-containing protein [Anaerolineae bacterium]|nr:DUF389 domain-containing protein [Anaerolineae bacterium]
MITLQKEITEASSPGFEFYVFVLLSGTIATLGLLTDSSPVIIGAMLLAPLMSPIIGIGMSTVLGNGALLKSSFFALIRGAMLAMLLAACITLLNSIMPFLAMNEMTGEILARTRPSPIDLVIALAGGLGGAYALSKPNLSAALPGVAISTALMPPLCTAGIGLATGRLDVTGGAFLLFITNASAIAFAAGLVFFILGFSPETIHSNVRNHGAKIPGTMVLSAVMVIGLLLPLTLFALSSIKETSREKIVSDVIASEIGTREGTQIVSTVFGRRDNMVTIDLTVRTEGQISRYTVNALKQSIEEMLGEPVELVISQIAIVRLTPEITLEAISGGND